jgi:integrase
MAEGRLSARQVMHAKPPKGRRSILLADGGRLYLQVTRGVGGSISRSWLLKYELSGKRHELGLGALQYRSLAQARERARALNVMLADGIDPLEAKRAERQRRIADAAKQTTFNRLVADYLKLHQVSWRSSKTADQWEQSLRDYAMPVIGELAPADIDQSLIFKIVEPLWKSVPITGGRVLDRIRVLLDYAQSRGLRGGDNPARHVRLALPKRSNRHEHFAAMPWPELPGFLAILRERQEPAARALEFLILNASRTAEVFGARWHEIDLQARTWTIPGSRMKGGKPHAIPLSTRAIELLLVERDGDRVFATLAEHEMRRLLRDMRPDCAVHGMRSTFRQWCAEKTNYPDHVVEVALAHEIGTAIERAYRRKAEMFERRRKLMQSWSDFCTSKPVSAAVVVPLR